MLQQAPRSHINTNVNAPILSLSSATMILGKPKLGHRVSSSAKVFQAGYRPGPRIYSTAATRNSCTPLRLTALPIVRAAPTEAATGVLLEEPDLPRIDSADGDREEDDCTSGSFSRVIAPRVSFVSLVHGKYTVQGRLLLPVPAANVYAMLTDYEGCHRVFANIAASEVLRLEGGGLQVVQSCRWKFLAFSGTFRVHLGVFENAEEGTLLFSLVQSNFMRDFEGRWAVTPAEAPESAAAAAPNGSYEWCEVEHQLSVVPSMPVPAPISYYTRSIFVRQVEGILSDLQRAVLAAAEAQGGTRHAGAGPGSVEGA